MASSSESASWPQALCSSSPTSRTDTPASQPRTQKNSTLPVDPSNQVSSLVLSYLRGLGLQHYYRALLSHIGMDSPDRSGTLLEQLFRSCSSPSSPSK